MPNSVRRDHPTALEIPVTVQGSKPVEGAERRELFTESTKTILVFENGAVLSLKSRLVAGQNVFLRNDQTGKEILCRVREVPQGSQLGATDLEFAVYDPEFWEGKAEVAAASVQKSEQPKPVEAAGEVSVPTPAKDCLVPTHEEIPMATPEVVAGNSVARLTRETLVPAHEQVPVAPSETTTAAVPSPPVNVPVAGPEPANEEESDGPKADEQLGVLTAIDTSRIAARASDTKEAKEIEAVAASANAPEEIERKPGAATKATAPSTETPSRRKIRNFRSTKNPIAIGIAASAVIAAALGVGWSARHVLGFHGTGGHRSSTPTTQPSEAGRADVATIGPRAATELTSASKSSGAAEVHVRDNNSGGAVISAASKIQPPTVAQGLGVEAAKNPAGTRADVQTGRESSSDQPMPVRSKDRKRMELNEEGSIPAKIVLQSQPTFPAWAKKLEVDSIVKLDALIDEKGNVAMTKVLSGPRVLQHAAEDAVALWIFEPARSDGKPTVAHMVLTVEFQR